MQSGGALSVKKTKLRFESTHNRTTYKGLFMVLLLQVIKGHILQTAWQGFKREQVQPVHQMSEQ